MSNEASIEGQTPETIQAEQPSQAVAGSDTQAQGTETVIQPVVETTKQQPPAAIPYERFAESRRELAESKRREQQLLEALNGRQPAQPAQAPASGIPTQDQFNSFEDWQIALGRYGARMELQESRQQDETKAQQTRFQDRVGKAQTNFSTKMSAAMATDPTLRDILESAPVSIRNDLQVTYMELDHPDIVGKHLATHPEIVQQLNAMYPDQAARELAKMDVKLAGPSGQTQKVSQMPKPIAPVGSGKASDIKHANDYSNDDVLRKLYPH